MVIELVLKVGNILVFREEGKEFLGEGNDKAKVFMQESTGFVQAVQEDVV